LQNYLVEILPINILRELLEETQPILVHALVDGDAELKPKRLVTTDSGDDGGDGDIGG
jgi:hypothetical protein